MTVTITLWDKSSSSYTFDPMQKTEILEFYSKLYWNHTIASYEAVMDNGQIVGMGA